MPGFENEDERFLGEHGTEIVASIKRVFDSQEMPIPLLFGAQQRRLSLDGKHVVLVIELFQVVAQEVEKQLAPGSRIGA